VLSNETVQFDGLLCLESYNAMYNPDPYQFPANRGITESYVKYQMYTNQPAYNARMSQYSYDDGTSAMLSATREYRIWSTVMSVL